MNEKFIIETNIYSKENTEVYNCNAIIFINHGTVDAWVNNEPLLAGTTTVPKGIIINNGNAGEIDQTQYKLTFLNGSESGLVAVRVKLPIK